MPPQNSAAHADKQPFAAKDILELIKFLQHQNNLPLSR